jgi:hypothetical protein
MYKPSSSKVAQEARAEFAPGFFAADVPLLVARHPDLDLRPNDPDERPRGGPLEGSQDEPNRKETIHAVSKGSKR